MASWFWTKPGASFLKPQALDSVVADLGEHKWQGAACRQNPATNTGRMLDSLDGTITQQAVSDLSFCWGEAHVSSPTAEISIGVCTSLGK